MGGVKVNINDQALQEHDERENARKRLEQFIKEVARGSGLYGKLMTIEYHTVGSTDTDTAYSIQGAWYPEKDQDSSPPVAFFENKLSSDSRGEWMRVLQPSSLIIYFSISSYRDKLEKFVKAIEKVSRKFGIQVEIESSEH